ncbi:MAG TPA: FeoA family protein [Bacteroidia bacterium]|nr:FeoA family protein [Bacteroidia bacterium]
MIPEKNNLASLLPGEKAIIEAFSDAELSLKLLEMGCTPGEEVWLDRTAPSGDPIAIHISGYVLSLRLAEASTVRIRRV